MRTKIPVLVILLVVLTAACGKDRSEPVVADAVPRQELEVVFLSGTAEAVGASGGTARPVRVGMRFGEGSTLRTLQADSRLDLRLASGSTVRLSGKSELALSELYSDGKLNVEKTGLSLISGTVLVKARLLVGDSRLQVRTQTAVAGVRGTSFLVSYDQDSGTSVAVQSGRVAVSPATTVPESLSGGSPDLAERLQEAGAIEVGAGRQLTVSRADADAHARRIAEAIAASDSAPEQAALAAARGTALRSSEAPTAVIREISDFAEPGAAAPVTGNTGHTPATGPGQARPVETRPSPGGLPEDIGIKE